MALRGLAKVLFLGDLSPKSDTIFFIFYQPETRIFSCLHSDGIAWLGQGSFFGRFIAKKRYDFFQAIN
jgi:hypothetical protein